MTIACAGVMGTGTGLAEIAGAAAEGAAARPRLLPAELDELPVSEVSAVTKAGSAGPVVAALIRSGEAASIAACASAERGAVPSATGLASGLAGAAPV